MSTRVWLRRAYDPPSRQDGYRVLVDRVWPRGVTREALRIDEWNRDVAPSNELRHWYGHLPERWEEFRERYRAELASGTVVKELGLKPLARFVMSAVTGAETVSAIRPTISSISLPLIRWPSG